MASYYWAKVWIEILYDYKMATLSDHLWRRTIELVLLAKEKNADGYLPKLEEMAFKLGRMSPEILEAELNDLANIEIAERRQDGWYLINFADRQGAMLDAERKSRQRDRHKKQEYHDTDTVNARTRHATVTERDTEQNRTEKKRTEQTTRVDSTDKITSQELPAEASPNFERDDLRRRMVAEISKVVRETLTVSNKRIEAEDYAEAWIDIGASDEDIPGFIDYWNRLPDKRYTGAPHLKSMGSHFKEYFNSRRKVSSGGVNPDGSIGKYDWSAT